MIDQGHTRVEITDYSSKYEFDSTCICPHNVRSSNYYKNKLHLKPSLGIKGSHCVCVQPKIGYNTWFTFNK